MVKAGSFIAAIVAAVALVSASIHASSSKFFQAATQADFLKGEVTNLSIDEQGRLMLGPATDLVYETSAPFLWAVTASPDGSLFVGTGNEGKVFRVDPQGRGTLFFDAPELEVHALAPAPNGGLYVATSPDGRIYKVDRDGKDSVFFDPDDKYIWSLALDAKGNLFAGTGEKGLIYKITPGREGDEVLRHESHACDGARFRSGRQSARGNRHPGTRPAGRWRGQGLRPARFPLRRNPIPSPGYSWPGVRRRAQRASVERRIGLEQSRQHAGASGGQPAADAIRVGRSHLVHGR